MIEISPVLLILLAEGFVVLFLFASVLVFLMLRNRKRRLKAVSQLASQLKKQSQVRQKETGSFLQDIYSLEDEALKHAIKEIDKQEKVFFQKLIDIFYRNDLSLIPTLDAALARLIDTYKSLKPKEIINDTGIDPQELEKLQSIIDELEKEKSLLSDELASTKKTMDEMIGEFGNMFGGGSDNELAKSEVVSQLDSKEGVVDAAKARSASSAKTTGGSDQK